MPPKIAPATQNLFQAQTLKEFEHIERFWAQDQPSLEVATQAQWGSFLSWSWASELSDQEKSLFSRMTRADAVESICRGVAHSSAYGDGHDARLLRRMGRAMHGTRLACQSSVLSHPWTKNHETRWINEPNMPPLPHTGWDYAATIERLVLTQAPWICMVSTACTAIPHAQIPAGLAAFGGLCLIFAHSHLNNRPRNPHKQSLLSNLESTYPDLAEQGFFAAARAQPNFYRYNPLASCSNVIDEALVKSKNKHNGQFFDIRSLASRAFPDELSWISTRLFSLRESYMLQELSSFAPTAPTRRGARI